MTLPTTLAIAAALTVLLMRLLERLGLASACVLGLAALGGAWMGTLAEPAPWVEPRLVLPLLAAPAAYRAGHALGHGLRNAARTASPGLLGLVTSAGRIFFVGGAIVLLAGRAGGWPVATCFFVAAALTITDPLRPRAALDAPRRGWGALLALIVTVTLASGDDLTAGLARVGLGCVAGLASAAVVRAGLGVARTSAARLTTHCAGVLLALGLATSLGGSELVALCVAGILAAALASRHTDVREPETAGPGADGSWAVFSDVGGAVLLVWVGVVAGASDPTLFALDGLWRAVTVWAAALVVGALLEVLVDGVPRAGASPGGPLAALSRSWSASPGLLAVAAVAPLDSASSPALRLFLQVTVLGLLLQGTGLRGALLALRSARHEMLEARWIAICAALESARRLRISRRVAPDVAEAMELTLERELREVEHERDESIQADPDTQRRAWTNGVRVLLSDARAELERANAAGVISPEAADMLLDELARKWRRAESQRLGALFEGRVSADTSPDRNL